MCHDATAVSIHTATMRNISNVWNEALHLASKYITQPNSRFDLTSDMRADFYYLETGRITILHGASNGQVQNMLYVEEGNLFNVAAVLGRSLTTYQDPGTQFLSHEQSVIWRFPGKLLHDLDFIRTYPHLIENLLSSLGFKLLVMHNTLSNAGTGDTITRICRFALNLSEANGNALVLDPNLSQVELANLFGVHRTSLLRALKLLRQMGVITQLVKTRLVIGDVELLQDLANG